MNFIKRLAEYLDSIEEAINSPIDIQWEYQNEYIIGTFELETIQYIIECNKQIGNNWSFTFCSLIDGEKNYKLTSNGKSAFRILSTIKEAMYHFYNTQNPNSILFSAIDDSDTRKRLYTKFCEDFTTKYGLSLSNRGTDDYVLYILFNNNLNDQEKEEMFESVKKVVEDIK